MDGCESWDNAQTKAQRVDDRTILQTGCRCRPCRSGMVCRSGSAAPGKTTRTQETMMDIRLTPPLEVRQWRQKRR